MIDVTAFRSISYGLYLIASQADGLMSGCTVNTFAQVTSDPLQVSVTVNKENCTASVIQQSGTYTAVCLSQNASMDLIGKFGFFCSRDVDKFGPFAVERDDLGNPYVAEQAVARFTVKVTGSLDLGTHILFVGTVVEAETLSDDEPMTYAYYHMVKGGKTPPRASSFVAEREEEAASAGNAAKASRDRGTAGAAGDVPSSGANAVEDSAASNGETPVARYGWKCTICGHIEEVDELPDDFACPICGVGKEMFERVEL